MFGIDPVLWNFLAYAALVGVGVVAILKVCYETKGFQDLPDSKPKLAFLPKYRILFSSETGTNVGADDMERVMKGQGFEETSRHAKGAIYTRGSAFGEFSIKIAKVNVELVLPVKNPIEINVEYGVVAGVAFDAGELWKFCQELKERLGGAVMT